MKTVISTPFPIPTDTAAEFGVPKERVRWLGSLMDAIHEGRDLDPFRGHRVGRVAKKRVNGRRARTRKA